VAKVSTSTKPSPRTAKAVREAWDEYKKNGTMPKHAEVKGRQIKSLYIQKLQDLWKKNTQDFVEGHARLPNGDWNPDAFDKEKARKAIQVATKVSKSRARTIVETETTRYYNDARREFYDEIETVEGYLFAIVRDAATTKWCLSRGTKGGLVFFKGSALLEKNTPPCHWNCRSELLPLSRLNPTHQKLLRDEDRWAKNNKLVPLPPGWNA
jgi:SPP1 gp7 family putative phage head morphogenesis protein